MRFSIKSFLLLSLMLISAAVWSKPARFSVYKGWTQDMKQPPMGSFSNSRWFCSDGYWTVNLLAALDVEKDIAASNFLDR